MIALLAVALSTTLVSWGLLLWYFAAGDNK
jgi:hypothetical protein